MLAAKSHLFREVEVVGVALVREDVVVVEVEEQVPPATVSLPRSAANRKVRHARRVTLLRCALKAIPRRHDLPKTDRSNGRTRLGVQVDH